MLYQTTVGKAQQPKPGPFSKLGSRVTWGYLSMRQGCRSVVTIKACSRCATKIKTEKPKLSEIHPRGIKFSSMPDGTIPITITITCKKLLYELKQC